jgi:hypothetical protein
VRNTPAAVYLGTAALAVGLVGLAAAPRAELPPEPAIAQAWEPTPVAFHDEMVRLMTFESASAQKAAQEQAAAAQKAALDAQALAEQKQREVLRDPKSDKRKSTRKRPRGEDGTAEVVVRDGNAARSARVPREDDDVRQGYAPEYGRGFGSFFGR